MQGVSLVSLWVAAVVACGPIALAASDQTGLTAGQKSAIGRKIWQNECAGSVAGLTTWNVGEEFPSLGIGHFIWYPAGFKGRFQESWPEFVKFATQRGADIPAVGRERYSPWKSKAQFQNDFKSPRMSALRNWLAANVTLQTDYIISRSRGALALILKAAPTGEKARIEANYRKVSTTPQGTYALIDYVNFKGDGTQVSERYEGRGWGLLQVLGEMKDVGAGSAAAAEFSAAAKRVLSRRIANSPSGRGEKRWEEGWHNRCATYARAL